MKIRMCIVTALAIGLTATEAAVAEPITLNVSGLVSTHQHHTALERKFFENLAEKTGLQLVVNFNPLDVIGVNMDDTLRLAGDGTFDIVQATIGNTSRDDPFLEGLDLIGIAPTLAEARAVVNAFRPAVAKRTEERLNVKTLGFFPYGPQLLFCKEKIDGLNSIKGRRVRSYSRSMSALIEHLGGIPVSMPFAEVYTALQRGVVECGITSITSANTGSWPEVTNYVFTLGLAQGQNAYFMNLDKWNSLTSEAQEALTKAFQELENDMWALTEAMYEDAMRCTTGEQPCEKYNKFKITRVDPNENDRALLAEATRKVILSVWANTCQPTAECVATWNETVGKVTGLEMIAK